MIEKLYSTSEVAEILQLKEISIRRHLRNKIIKGIRIGKHWRIKESDLQEFLTSKETLK